MDVSLEGINKSFGPVKVLKDIDLIFPDRKFVTLLGPSGCGKTTLLRMIAGLESITSGVIRFGDRVVNNLAPRDRNIAMVFQSYALYPQMSVRQNLSYGLRVRGTPKAEQVEAVARVARVLEIDHLLDRKPGQLSGGQRQRVALGRAMVRRPDIFLMDEPLSNLDAKLRGQMRAELTRLHREFGSTIVYVTHDQVEAMTMAQKIVVLHNGHVAQMGAPLDLYHEPDNTFVAQFIGVPKMNLVKGALQNGLFTLPCGEQVQLDRAFGSSSELQLGVRPEHLQIVRGGRGWQVDLVERLGVETFIHLHCETQQHLVVRQEGDCQYDCGEKVALTFAPSRCFLFENDGSRRLPKAAVNAVAS